jgi:hypothetical protein
MPLRVVNAIPVTLSDETRQDSEASVTANPVNPRQLALTAFTRDPASSGNAPIFVSTDGGTTWALSVCLPGGNSTNDVSVRFGGTSGVLYAAILRPDTGAMDILRAATFPPVGLMTVLIDRNGPDQPWVETGWAGAGSGTTQDRVYVSDNRGTAEIQFSLNAATAAAPAGFGAAVDIESRAGSDRPSVRTSVHRTGTVYGMFVGVRPGGSDIVVVRDDNWGSGGWTNLVDPGGGAGLRIVTGVTVPPVGTLLGSVRVSSRLAIAVDPRNRLRVYAVWCDGAVTAASPYRLHLRRSDDGGATWSGDLRTIANVTNPGLAVNVRGTVGLLYQRLTTPAGGNRWETHLEISDDRFATVRTDMIVANLPDQGGTFQPTIGDYANLVAVGKDFHGAFCGFNQPVNANFPGGVTYQRNTDFVNQRLLGNDGVTVRANSIDPFYVHFTDVEPHQDFYVRDWTDSPTSGDDGVEPSTHPAFWATPDVWNRRGTSPGTFVNDQPPNEPAGNGAGNVGDNWAFARIRRRQAATGGAATTVTAHFLVSKLGTGSNYVDASSADPDVSFPDPDPTLTFNPADVGPTTTAPFRWHLNPVSSSHLCLAVEISTPGDPYVGQALRGRAPGWPDQDLEILDDNNKAQRNMGLSTVPARGVESGEFAIFAIVHNAATFRRDIRLGYALDPVLRRRVAVSLETLGQRRVRAKAEGTMVLAGMEPGENRWVGVAFKPPPGQSGELAVLHVSELAGEAAVNGFGLGVRLGTQKGALAHVIERHRSVFTRLGALGVNQAGAEVRAARAALRTLPTPAAWIGGVSRRWQAVSTMLRGAAGENDPAAVVAALRRAQAAIRANPADALVALASVLERVDVMLTMRQLAGGDRADILQTARWQAELLTRGAPFAGDPAAGRAARPTLAFASAYGERRAHDAEYVGLLRQVLPALRALRTTGDRARFGRLVGALEAAVADGSPAAAQGAHRAVLLHLQALGRR